MARKHPKGADNDGTMILPLRLVTREGLTAAQYSEQCRERAQWFRDRDINPGDWSKGVYPVLLASWKAHDLPYSTLERARLRAELFGPRSSQSDDVQRPIEHPDAAQ